MKARRGKISLFCLWHSTAEHYLRRMGCPCPLEEVTFMKISCHRSFQPSQRSRRERPGPSQQPAHNYWVIEWSSPWARGQDPFQRALPILLKTLSAKTGLVPPMLSLSWMDQPHPEDFPEVQKNVNNFLWGTQEGKVNTRVGSSESSLGGPDSCQFSDLPSKAGLSNCHQATALCSCPSSLSSAQMCLTNASNSLSSNATRERGHAFAGTDIGCHERRHGGGCQCPC